jgi:hypothetical protein
MLSRVERHNHPEGFLQDVCRFCSCCSKPRKVNRTERINDPNGGIKDIQAQEACEEFINATVVPMLGSSNRRNSSPIESQNGMMARS